MLHFQKDHLTVFQSALYLTTTAIIESDQVIILTDPNWLPDEVAEIREYIDKHLKNKEFYIIYTHSDFDHIIGAGAFPQAKVIASEAFQHQSKKDIILQKIHTFDQKYYIDRKYTHQYPFVDTMVSLDGETMQLGDVKLTFYQAPGHTNDGLFTVVEPYGIFISGDYLSDVEFPFIYSSYTDYVKTIHKAVSIMDHHAIQYHVPGHGNVTELKQEIMDRIEFSKYYLEQLVIDHKELENECRNKFPFFEAMEDSHLNNIQLARKEENKDRL